MGSLLDVLKTHSPYTKTGKGRLPIGLSVTKSQIHVPQSQSPQPLGSLSRVIPPNLKMTNPFLSSKEAWTHTWGRGLLIAWYWAIVGSIGSGGGCGPWLATIAGLMIPWVDGLGLPKWRHRWSWLVNVHYESIPDLVSPIRWERRQKLVKINFLKWEHYSR